MSGKKTRQDVTGSRQSNHRKLFKVTVKESQNISSSLQSNALACVVKMGKIEWAMWANEQAVASSIGNNKKLLRTVEGLLGLRSLT